MSTMIIHSLPANSFALSRQHRTPGSSMLIDWELRKYAKVSSDLGNEVVPRDNPG
eukprot:UN00577